MNKYLAMFVIGYQYIKIWNQGINCINANLYFKTTMQLPQYEQ